ncbi:MAG: methyltransferase domain-containing protein [Ktedonobacteraceae bacterium]|nr:methyltransferase domain-containing protein [Ktedonobacteraceae bacterium]
MIIAEKNRSLVEAIETYNKRQLSPRVRAAFLAVDRAAFVPHHYEQRPGEWLFQKTGDEAYENRQLVVQVTNGLPSSSSSLPSLMASMLEALDLHPGQRVLEIGTGTGYNAALLGHIVGETGLITSIDIDARLVALAHRRLEEEGVRNVLARVHNGFLGYAPHRPYDRIIATAGFQHLPHAWSEQLREGGICVGNWLGPVVQPLLLLKKTTMHADLTGTIIPSGALFMEMHHGEAPKMLAIDWTRYDRILPVQQSEDEELRQDLNNSAFLFFLSHEKKAVQRHMRSLDGRIAITLIDTQDDSSITIVENTLIARGTLIETVNALKCRKHEIPAITEYHLHYHDGCLSVEWKGRREMLSLTRNPPVSWPDR